MTTLAGSRQLRRRPASTELSIGRSLPVACVTALGGIENLTSCMSWVNLGVIFGVVYPVATTSVAARSVAQNHPAEPLQVG